MERLIGFDELMTLRPIADAYHSFASDYVYMRIGPQACADILSKTPLRISGLALCMVRRGNTALFVNSQRYVLDKMSILSVNSNQVIEACIDSKQDVDLMVIVLSSQFLRDINIDLNAVNFQSMIKSQGSPVLELSDDEKAVMQQYFAILEYNASQQAENIFTKNIARSLVQSVFYQMLQLASLRTASLPEEDGESQQLRKMTYLREFMQLVQLHHFKERSLSFYADRMCITPKYLSRIIKEATGRSAADWIDQFVILEAKNLLRFSSKNVQQVAYALNFSTQSSFGKFFKHLTGMSPSEYQKT